MSTEGISSRQFLAWKDDELEVAARCLACGESYLVPVHDDLEDLLGSLPGRWGFLACSKCSSLHLSPRPTLAAIGKAYPADYVTHGDAGQSHARDNGISIIWQLCNGYLNSRFSANRQPALQVGAWLVPWLWPIRQQLDYFYRHMPARSGRLLDVGCGNGAFLLRARAAGWQVQGIEPDPGAAEVARRQNLEVRNCDIGTFSPEVTFDWITLSHVFEHLHSPRESLQRMHGWLRPGGGLWMALPNPTGVGHRVFGRNWFSLDPPRHVFLPPQAQVVAMLEAAGYVDVHVLRRGRGSHSSVLPSVDYSRRRRGRMRFGGAGLTLLIDALGSLASRFSEETVVVARRGVD
ncbi:MAG: class I SAM-dependent methyltransferase [Pseudoxanthomonas mexicana]|nr:class I SAM-dependent methyltransferase [Pseudoxanthomonas mexicana]